MYEPIKLLGFDLTPNDMPHGLNTARAGHGTVQDEQVTVKAYLPPS